MTDVEPRALLDLARSVADEAGRMLLRDRPHDLGVAATKSSPTDVVTEMDTAAEKLIVERILAARPGDAFLGEEGGQRGGESGVRWIVDPIDGTVNYLYDLPAWSVSVAAEVDGEVVAGVVVVPALRETYEATRGGGAFRTRDGGAPEPITRRRVPALREALVGTGFEYLAARRAVQGRVVAELLPRIRDIRRGGSAALDLCQVATGRLDGYFERGVHAWDIAAGGLVVTEAGGRVGGLDGAPASETMTVAAPPPLFDELRAALSELDAGAPYPE
jgi:myo-inositol-1(or 4)-monophosphatase